MYNNLNELLGFKYNNDIYYYVKNIQDDVIGILDSNYNLIVKYIYDSWGNIISIKDNNGNDISNDNNHIGNINPFRYRSYYYDKETNLYYLNSRYYNPVWGRFINADGIIGSEEDINGYNLYMYCNNNPVINIDSGGDFALPLVIPGIIIGIGAIAYTYSKAKKVVSGIINTAASIIDDYRDRTQLKMDTKVNEKVDEKVTVKVGVMDVPKYMGTEYPKDAPIYRYGDATPGNLTPKIQDLYDGLSFSTKYRPDSVSTTINAINSTGILCAYQDKTTHISVVPCHAPVIVWYNAGPDSIWTKKLLEIVR